MLQLGNMLRTRQFWSNVPIQPAHRCLDPSVVYRSCIFDVVVGRHGICKYKQSLEDGGEELAPWSTIYGGGESYKYEGQCKVPYFDAASGERICPWDPNYDDTSTEEMLATAKLLDSRRRKQWMTIPENGSDRAFAVHHMERAMQMPPEASTGKLRKTTKKKGIIYKNLSDNQRINLLKDAIHQGCQDHFVEQWLSPLVDFPAASTSLSKCCDCLKPNCPPLLDPPAASTPPIPQP